MQENFNKVQIDGVIEYNLTKELAENEIICPTCKGFGLMVYENPFYLKDEQANKFDKHVVESLGYCPDCYNGKVKVCPYCGRKLKKNSPCDCQGAKKEFLKEIERRDIERWRNVKKISLEEARKKYEMLYIENNRPHSRGFSHELGRCT